MNPHGGNLRIILLMSNLTYRAAPFMDAARRLGLEVVRGVDMPAALAEQWHATLPLDFRDPDRAAADLVAYARRHPVRAILSIDDSAGLIAARACAALGLSHNAPDAAQAARDKYLMRGRLSAAGVPCPRFRLAHTTDDPAVLARGIEYPCVVKPTLLSGSQGVIRADTPDEFVAAFRRTSAIVRGTGGPGQLLIEDYIPGDEVVLEGILAYGRLQLLALFDKPDPLIGPYFEETIYVTPSRLPTKSQDAIIACAAAACAALGLREGPVHAELRLNEAGPWVVEAAGRSIGGLCARILRFGSEEIALEEMILRRAVGLDIGTLQRERRAGGVMMIPIPRAGLLSRVDGLKEARAVPGIEEIDITIPLRHPVTPLPEGSSYLGFIFARGQTPAQVEAALREAHGHLSFTILPLMPLLAHHG